MSAAYYHKYNIILVCKDEIHVWCFSIYPYGICSQFVRRMEPKIWTYSLNPKHQQLVIDPLC